MKLIKRKAILLDLDCVITSPLVRSTMGALGDYLDRLGGVLDDDPVLQCELIESYTSGYVDRPYRLIWQILHADLNSHWFTKAEHPERLRGAVRELRKKFDASFIRKDFSNFAVEQSSKGKFLVTYSSTIHSEDANYFLACAELGAVVRAIKTPGRLNRGLLKKLIRDLDIDAGRSFLIVPDNSEIIDEARVLGFQTALLSGKRTDSSKSSAENVPLDDYSQIEFS